jgi:hypothetical protein
MLLKILSYAYSFKSLEFEEIQMTYIPKKSNKKWWGSLVIYFKFGHL